MVSFGPGVSHLHSLHEPMLQGRPGAVSDIAIHVR